MPAFVTLPTFSRRRHHVILDGFQSRVAPLVPTFMCTEDVVVAVDVGTSGTKAGVYQASNNRLLRVFRHSHAINAERNMVTQRPSNWLSAALAACADVLRDVDHVSAISVTGQMQNLIGCGNAPPLLNDRALLYSDARAVYEAENLSKKTRTSILPTDLLPKLALLPPPSGEQEYKLMIGATDYICYELSGRPDRHFTDATTAATTGLTRQPHRAYHTALFQQASLDSFLPLLPEILPRPAIVGYLCHQMAQMLGRPEAAGVPVIHAGGDAFSATVGAGCDEIGSGCYVYGGSSGWVGQTLHLEKHGGSGLALAHAADEKSVIVAGSVAALGACVSHACEVLLSCNINDLDHMAAMSQIGASGLVYVPYITGRRCPPADAVGALYGLNIAHAKRDVARAVIEGIVFALVDASDGMSCNEVEVVGGVTSSAVFVDGIQALFGGARLGERDVGVKGAGVIGARVLGLTISNREMKALSKVRAEVSGNDLQKWKEAFSRWKQVVSHLEGLWSA
eukprot:TRINITY_DN369_c0_g1_i1.p1 TRINITY_DN369_c0_g1~~TRINITY_DN369_c0_g1_i1.p1  ORF type:complete len:510 (+),score=42.61 TRINITY_DN369_c0_g1_i1:5154-6683(+)